MTILETERLLLSRLSYDDREFIYELVNEPSFKKYIGDKDVHSLEDADRYLREGPIGHYDKFGFGLFLVSLKGTETPIGICGLIKREDFDDPDIGFAFLERHREQGYANESSRAVLAHGFEVLNLHRIIAMVDPDNKASVKLLENHGFVYKRDVRMPEDNYDISLFAKER